MPVPCFSDSSTPWWLLRKRRIFSSKDSKETRKSLLKKGHQMSPKATHCRGLSNCIQTHFLTLWTVANSPKRQPSSEISYFQNSGKNITTTKVTITRFTTFTTHCQVLTTQSCKNMSQFFLKNRLLTSWWNFRKTFLWMKWLIQRQLRWIYRLLRTMWTFWFAILMTLIKS